MSFDDFMHNPKNYLVGHKVEVRSDNSVLATMTRGPREDCLGDKLKCEQWSQNPGGPYLTMMHMIAAGAEIQGSFRKAIGVAMGGLPGQSRPERVYKTFPNGSTDKGFRWLMFTENVATYMQIDAAASLVMTGPLTGCTIAFGRDNAGNPVIVHANCNVATGDAARINQSIMIVNVCKDKLAANAGKLIHAVYKTDYAGLGFVFAKRSGVVWKVYAYGMESGVKELGIF